MNGIGKLVKALANMTFDPPDEWIKEFDRLGKDIGEICKGAVIEGAQPMADEIRAELGELPEDKFRYLNGNDAFQGVPEDQKKALLDSLGITKADVDFNGNYNVKIGFDGYGSFKTKKYPKGIPNQLLARAIESGSSVRAKTPFMKTSIKKKKKIVVDTISIYIESNIKNYKV